MKKFLAGLVMGAVLATGVTSWAVAQQVRLLVDGQDVAFPGAPPQMLNGRTMVPARPLAEALGAKVDWNPETSTVVITSGSSPVTAEEPAPAEPEPTDPPAPVEPTEPTPTEPTEPTDPADPIEPPAPPTEPTEPPAEEPPSIDPTRVERAKVFAALRAKFPGVTLGGRGTLITIGDMEYDVAPVIEANRVYLDITTLLTAGVITNSDVFGEQ